MADGCDKAALYRPRRPRTSPLWRLFDRYFQKFLDAYEERYRPRLGCLRDVVTKRIRAFMDCGILERGLARARCETCGKEVLVPFSCKGTGFCPSCQAKRRAELAVFLNEHVLEPVPHRHVVLSLPRRLRPFFLYDRSLLRPLARSGWEALKEILQTAARSPGGVPGAVIGIHSCGDLLDWHPHLHILISWGVFTAQGIFLPVKEVPSKDDLEKLFRHKVLRMLIDRKLISQDVADNLLSWPHPGFGGYISEKISPAPDRPGHDSLHLPDCLLGYLVRAPVCLDRMTLAENGSEPEQKLGCHPHGTPSFDPVRGLFRPNMPIQKATSQFLLTPSVLYRSDRVHPRHQANFRSFPDPLDSIAALLPHIADVHERNTIYYGFYSNRSRGERKKKTPTPDAPAAPSRAPFSARRAWAEMIRRVYEADPLVCPDCQGRLRVVAFIEDAGALDRILRHLGLAGDGLEPANERAPPEAAFAEIVVEPFLDDLAPGIDLID